MAERPISFKAPMVRAILDGRKTVTRRLLKPQPFPAGYHEGEIDCLNLAGGARFSATAVGGAAVRTEFVSHPYEPGDHLWVREAWRTPKRWDEFSPSKLVSKCLEAGYKSAWCPTAFEADGGRVNWEPCDGKTGRLRAPMHLPRPFARITLKVLGVKVERLKEISEEEARAEGVAQCGRFWAVSPEDDWDNAWGSAIAAFHALWDNINGEREGASWEANPWVAAISFRRVA